MSGYIGNIPTPQATQTRDEFTATAGQTSFATSGYTPNYLDVYLNGVHLDTSDYTATNGSDVVLASGAALNDELVVVAWSAFEAYNVSFTNLTDKPTTISGYGITDAFDGAFSSLTGTPTTISGYGITDAFDGAYSSLTGTPTTLSGYGITDAAALAGANFTGTVDVDATLTANTLALDNGSNDWTFEVSSNKLIIKYGGTAKMELDTSGNLKVTGNVTAYGTI